ncbi:protein-export chaperone SecB [Rhodobacteraceae bacterium 2376]|uniref:Protein-export protein SecB n=1 Tax=Rhabdonatronobacter sediminivivens TaxID=2743469 RepID=A0A7Z0I2L2_9RHOB|nr:protein-export chaperone SecB [Rhabdonatronobacter sediminivivens]NYS26805.1 protein-export chaperone SecB [Rhabdonatronobacter sediminivivens]
MTENGNNGAGAAAQPQQAQTGQNPQVKMRVLSQFVKDLSFENIAAQKAISGANVQPDIKVQVSLDARKRDTENQYEVTTKYKVESKNKSDDSVLFVVELDYAGVFHIENVPQEQMHPFLLIECPRILFPFARRIISDATRDGGYPPLNLDNVDFLALYRQELQRQAALRAQQGEEAPATN